MLNHFALGVRTLMRHPERIGQIRARLLEQSRRPALIRFFMWWFNIDNYAYHTYLLAALLLYINSPERRNTNMELITALLTMENAVYAGLSYIGYKIYSLAKRLQPAAGPLPNEEPLPEDRGPAAAARPAEVSTTLEVTPEVLPHLRTLNINAAIGAQVDPSTFAKAYRKLALQRHPDKGGRHEDFIALQGAYEALSTHQEKQTALMIRGPDPDNIRRVESVRRNLASRIPILSVGAGSEGFTKTSITF